MSIVTTVEAVPSRLHSLYAALAAASGGEVRERLEAWATPPSLRSRGDAEERSTELFKNTLQEAMSLGMVEDVGGHLSLGAEARPKAGARSPTEDHLRRFILSVLREPDRAERAGQRRVALALSWLLTKDPLRPLDFSQGPQEALRRDLGDAAAEVELTSTSRYQNLLYWARFLGLASIMGLPSGGGSRRVVADPSAAIRRALPDVFGDDVVLDINAFVTRLGRSLPVLEGGWARASIEAMRTEPAEPDRLSVATSLALRRLGDRGDIALRSVADARPRLLDFGLSQERVSHVHKGRPA